MVVHTLPVGVIQTNCYVVSCERTSHAVVIDPGGDAEDILALIERENLIVAYVLNSHCHFDHIGANGEIVAATGAKLAVHPAEVQLLESGGGAALFSLPALESPRPDIQLGVGQRLVVGDLTFTVLLTPGHSPGGISFYVEEGQAVLVGDALFAGSVGRTDLPGSDGAQLLRSIREVLFALPDDTVVYPGHGPATTIGDERRSNPWVGGC